MSIDWSAALHTAADPEERALVQGLLRLESLRPGRPQGPAERMRTAWVWPLAATTAVAIAQVVSGLTLVGVALVNGASWVEDGRVQLALASAFSAASLLLAATALRDDRAFLLLATFVLTASAFVQPLLHTSAPGARLLTTPLFRGLYPDVFVSAALWELAIVFPSVRRFTATDVLTRRMANIVWLLALGLFGANLSLAYLSEAFPTAALGRNHWGFLYWRVFAILTLPAIALVLLRAHRAPRPERQKVVRFAAAVAAGAGPFLVFGVARSIPLIDGWTRSLAVRTWMDPLVLVPLGALPLLTSVAVLMDAPFDTGQAIDPAAPRARRWLHRSRSGGMSRLRQRRVRDRLSAALDHLRLARGSRELTAVLSRELQAGIGADTVRIIDPQALPRNTALMMLADTAVPIDLSRDCEPFVLLPRQDREWLDEHSAVMIAAVRLRDGTIPAVVLLGQPRKGDGFSGVDRWFIGTLVTAAAAAWPPAGEFAAPDDPADECTLCGRLRQPGEDCCPGGSMALAALPRRLAGKYTIARRLGSGSMGVVYLGRDKGLGRDVALKTLPGLRDGAVARLRDEARAMAALNHPAVATIYGVEVWRGTPVLVLEYFPRGTLAAALAGGPLAVDGAVRLGIRLADALAHMHERSVLHRDVKPSNIGFTSDGGAKLFDFGLAGAREPTAGTRGYLPPEALDGAAPDQGVDLWALAIVLRDACRRDRRLIGFFRRALNPRPAERYQSAREMAAALRLVIRAMTPGDG